MKLIIWIPGMSTAPRIITNNHTEGIPLSNLLTEQMLTVSGSSGRCECCSWVRSSRMYWKIPKCQRRLKQSHSQNSINHDAVGQVTCNDRIEWKCFYLFIFINYGIELISAFNWKVETTLIRFRLENVAKSFDSPPFINSAPLRGPCLAPSVKNEIGEMMSGSLCVVNLRQQCGSRHSQSNLSTAFICAVRLARTVARLPPPSLAFPQYCSGVFFSLFMANRLLYVGDKLITADKGSAVSA